MAIRFDNIEAINLLNNQGEQTIALTNDQGIIVSGNVAMVSGNATGKFAVKSTGVHASYDFYNDGTSYFNGGVTVDAGFSQTGGADSSFSGDVIVKDFVKSTDNNLKFSAGGTHVFNVDVNANIYPAAHNQVDLGFSSTLAFRQLYLSGDITSSAAATFGGNLDVGGTVTLSASGNIFSDSIFQFLTTGSGAQHAKFKGIQLSTSYSGTPPSQGILFGTDTNLYRDSSNVLKTDDSLVVGSNLQVDNTLSVGSGNSRFIWNSGSVSVTGEGTDNGVEIDWTNGTHVIPSLAYAFRVKLVTTGTGTDSGASYVVYYNNTSSSWVVRHVTIADTTSNHPLLSMKTESGVGTYMIAYHNHSSTYTIRYWVETFDSGDQDMDGHTFGSDFQWQRLDDTLTYEDGHVKLPDNNQLRLGAGNDLRLYHNGTDSFIDDAGNGDLRIRSNFLKIEKYTGEIMAAFNDDNAVSLYYDNNTRLETSSSGVNIIGDLTVSDVRTGSNGGLHLGDDSSILSIGRGNEIWTQNSVNGAATLYINYRGYNGGSSHFRSLDIRDGKAGQIANFNGADKSVSFAGAVSTGGYLTLNAADNIPRLVFNGGGDDFMFSNTANYFGLYNDTDSRWDIQVDGAGNTTFAGNVTTGGDINVPEYVVHDGDTNTHIRFTTDRIRLVAGGNVKFDSNSPYITGLDWTEIAGDAANINISGFNNDAGYLTAVPEFLEEKYIYNSNDSNGVYMPMVKGGMYTSTSGSVNGAIKVKLPAYKSNMMFTIYVDVFEYTTGETVTLRVSGYAYGDAAASWHNCSVVNIADNTDRNYTVRFYSDTTNSEQYFTIGEVNSVWSYPQVNLRDFWGGYNTNETEAKGTWDVSLVTSFSGTLKHTFNDNFAASDWDRIRDKPSTFAPIIGTGSTQAMAGNTAIPSASDILTLLGTNNILNWTVDQGSTNIHSGNYSNTQLSNAEVISAVVASTSIDGGDKTTIRSNIGAGTSSFDGAYGSLSGTPTLGTAAAAATGDFATAAQGTTADAALPKAGGTVTGTLTVEGDTAFFFTKSTDKTLSRIIPRGVGNDVDKGLFSLYEGVTGASSLEQVRLDSAGSSWINGGSLGIGNTSPTYTLDVSGNAGFDEYLYHNGDSNTYIRLTADRVRIVAGGTTKFDSNSTYITSQRAISSTPTDGATTTAISSDWAFDNVKTAVPANAVFTDTVNTFDGAYGSLSGTPTIPSGNAIIDWTTDQGTTNIHTGNYNNTQLSNAEVISAVVASSSIDNADQGTIRSNIGAGTSNLAIGTTASTAMAGNTALLAIGTTATTAMAGNTTIPSGNAVIDWTADQGSTNIDSGNYTNTTYSAGSGLDLTGTTFSIESDLRDGVTRIGKDTSNYIAIGADTNVIDFHVGGVWVARMESDGDLHMKGDVIAFSDIFNP